jgi:3-methyladenine DNA glycosylase Tag
MRRFSEIEALAAKRKGGVDALEKLLIPPKSKAQISGTGDDRFLSEMTRVIFQSGFNWSLIDRKWPGFEAAFEGFDVGRWVFMSSDDEDDLVRDKRIVGNRQKIRAVAGNAVMLSNLAKAHGSAANWFAAIVAETYFESVQFLKDHGARLGGRTGQMFLRRMGVDALIYSDSVIAALKREGVIEKAPTSKRDIAVVKDAVLGWQRESGRPLNSVSQILAFSVAD